jgi:hypothetical protein
MRNEDYDGDISDRCALCQVKYVYHGAHIDGGPSEEVARCILKFGYNVDPSHVFVPMIHEDLNER